MIRRFFQRPIIRFSIAPCRQIPRLRNNDAPRASNHVPQAKSRNAARAKHRIAIFGSLAQFLSLDHRAQRCRQFRQQSVFAHNSLAYRASVVGSGTVGPDASADSWPSGTSLIAKVNFIARGAARGQAAALRRRKMLAHHIDFLDRRTASDQRGMKLLKILQRTPGSSGCSTSAEPPPEIRKNTSVRSSQRANRSRIALPAAKLSAVGIGWPPTNVFQPGSLRGWRSRSYKNPCPAEIPAPESSSIPPPSRSEALPKADGHDFAEIREDQFRRRPCGSGSRHVVACAPAPKECQSLRECDEKRVQPFAS